MRSDIELAWAAGLFEGEGFLISITQGRRDYLMLGIEMRDLDILERFAAALKQGGISPKAKIALRPRSSKNPRHSDIYRWAFTGAPARAAYEILRPHLGQRRVQRGDQILRSVDSTRAATLKPRNCEQCGNEFQVKDYGHSKRFCSKPCWGRWHRAQPGQRERDRIRQARYEVKRKAARIAARSIL